MMVVGDVRQNDCGFHKRPQVYIPTEYLLESRKFNTDDEHETSVARIVRSQHSVTICTHSTKK